MMFHLIKKDFLIQKRNLVMSAIIALIMMIAWSNMGSIGFMMSTVVVSYLLIFGAVAIEDKNNSDVMLVSLPISKIKIVLAKYVSVYVFAAFAMLINLLINFLAEIVIKVFGLPFTVSTIHFQQVIEAFGILTIFAAISFPLIFRYGFIKARLVNLILFFLFVLGITSFLDTLDGLGMNITNTKMMIPLLGAMLILLLAGSIWLSLSFYRKREL